MAATHPPVALLFLGTPLTIANDNPYVPGSAYGRGGLAST